MLREIERGREIQRERAKERKWEAGRLVKRDLKTE